MYVSISCRGDHTRILAWSGCSRPRRRRRNAISGSATCDATREWRSGARWRAAGPTDHRLRGGHGPQSRVARGFRPRDWRRAVADGPGVARSHRRPVVRAQSLTCRSRTRCRRRDVVRRVVTLDDAAEGEAAREMFRVLAPGGVALVNAAALNVLHGSHSVLTQEQRRYTPALDPRALQDAGFAIERVTYTNMMTLPLALAVRLSDQLTGQRRHRLGRRSPGPGGARQRRAGRRCLSLETPGFAPPICRWAVRCWRWRGRRGARRRREPISERSLR